MPARHPDHDRVRAGRGNWGLDLLHRFVHRVLPRPGASEESSGQSRHQGPITKAGNTYARKLLIEAAWQHRRPYARPGERLLRQLNLVGPATRIRALEGNHRLHHQWEHFDARKKMSVKANTAIARELAGWCWSLAAPLQQGARMNAA